MEYNCNYLIIGAGITGLTIARELLELGVDDVLIIEKEKHLGLHASGRNSGVLHAGIYYNPDSFKARFCVEGNRLMKEFCKNGGLTLKETGKVIVTKNESELDGLFELRRRAVENGVRVKLIDEHELVEIEPYAKTNGKALFSPDTTVINPIEVLDSIANELSSSGRVKILFGTSFVSVKDERYVVTSKGNIKFDKLINAAGAYAEKVASCFGVGKDYNILPFKGTYKKLRKNRSYLVRGNIYPVPDLRNTFLGVHFTRGIDDNVYAGPTAIPAIGREEYKLLNGISLEAFSILWRDLILFFMNDSFRNIAVREIKKYSKHHFFEEAKKLVNGLSLEDLEDTDKVGIRPQLVHWPTKELVTDFVLLEERDSIHILNAISPAFTSSMAFAKYVVSEFLS